MRIMAAADDDGNKENTTPPLSDDDGDQTERRAGSGSSTDHRMSLRGRIQTEEEDRAIIRKIRALYDAGVPFYTKDKLRDLAGQLEAAADGRRKKVKVEGLDGKVVEFEIETGRGMPIWGEDGEDVTDTEFENFLVAPCVSYVTVQELTTLDEFFSSEYAFLTLSISHYVGTRKKVASDGGGEAVDTVAEPDACGDVDRSAEELDKFFHDIQRQWEESATWKRLRSTLASVQYPDQISNVVGFAFASMKSEDDEEENTRSAFQHALLLSLRTMFGSAAKDRAAGDLRCFVQDPAYTKSDKLVLQRNGIEVLQDPRGFLEVDDSSVIISIAPNIAVKQVVMDIARPAVIMWNTVLEQDPDYPQTDPDSPRVRTILNEFYDKLAFPEDVENFGDMSIYIRKPTVVASKI